MPSPKAPEIAPEPEKGDNLKEECGVFGIFNHEKADSVCFMAMHALQHRGQESAGMARIAEGSTKIKIKKGVGLVTEIFSDEKFFDPSVRSAIGHTRYSTTGSSISENAQPLTFVYPKSSVALAHNGNITDAENLRTGLMATGSIFHTESDSEIFSHLIAKDGSEIEIAAENALKKIKAAFALVILTPEKMIAVQDRFGIRPLCLGKLGDSFVVASENCAFSAIGAEFIEEIKPGHMAVIDKHGYRVKQYTAPETRKLCSFEFIYFARPDSSLDGLGVHETRVRLGENLADESKTEADIVVGVPDSGLSTAIGYSRRSGILLDTGLMKNRYVGRTFIQPGQQSRELKVMMKLSPVVSVLKGKRVILIDDSLVRGTTSARIISMIRDAGAKEVHMKISSPPISHSCFYGIDTSIRKELVASDHSVEQIRQKINADTLHFISMESMLAAISPEGIQNERCTSCFNGNYLH